MTENYTLTDDQEALFVATYPNHGKVWFRHNVQALYQSIADAIRDNRPKPFEVGDVVHMPEYTSSWARNCEILLVVDRRGVPGAVIRDGDDNVEWFGLTELAHGEKSND